MRCQIYLLLALVIFGLPTQAQLSEEQKTRIEEHMEKIPLLTGSNINALSQYILDNAYTDTESAYSVFAFLDKQISYNINLFLYMQNLNINALPEGYQTFGNKLSYFFYKFGFGSREKKIAKQNSLDYILKKKKAVCQGYSKVFDAFCQTAKLESQTIVGYNKGFNYFDGDSFYFSNHTWNAVKLEEEWLLLDATNGIWNPKPDTFLYTHLPNMPMWQMVKHPISMETFETDEYGIMDQLKSGRELEKIKTLTRRSPAYDFKDSIADYVAMSEADKAIFLAQQVSSQNPKNHRDQAMALLAYGDHILQNQYKETLPVEAQIAIKDTCIGIYNAAKKQLKLVKKREIKQTHLRQKNRNKSINRFVKDQSKKQKKKRSKEVKDAKKQSKEELKAAKKEQKETIAQEKASDREKATKLKEEGKSDEAKSLKEESSEKLENMRYMSSQMLADIEKSNFKKNKKLEDEKAGEIKDFDQILKEEAKRYDQANKLESKRYKGDKEDLSRLSKVVSARAKLVKATIKVKSPRS